MRFSNVYLNKWGLLWIVGLLMVVRVDSYQERRRYVEVSRDGKIDGER